MAEHHELMGGKLHVYKRENSTAWQCSTYLAGKNWRVSTKEDSLSRAKDFAEDWYLELRGKSRSGDLKVGKSFKLAAETFMEEYRALASVSAKYIELQELRIRVHLLPFFEKYVCPEITPDLVQQYRIHRMSPPKVAEDDDDDDDGDSKPKAKKRKPPARATLHQEMVSLRQILKTANRKGWIPYLPDLSAPFRGPVKISHRAWFSHKEYQALFTATRDRAANPRHNRGRWKWEGEQLHDFVLFMVNTGLRPDEAKNLEFRDVEIVHDQGTDEEILDISVRGKRGVGYCKSMPGAVPPFKRLLQRLRPHHVLRAEHQRLGIHEEPPTEGRLPEEADRLFPNDYREMLNDILTELKLKHDREGQVRTAYSLRHTYICFRLLQGADIYQVAKNCRTSVEMIEKFYASHIKGMIDASAVNVMKPQPQAKAKKRPDGRPPKQPANAKGAKSRRGGGDPKNRQ